MPEFISSVEIDAPIQYSFRWHESPCAFERLAPPWENIEVQDKTGSIDTGSVTIKNKVGPLSFRLKAQHSNFIRNEQFYDEMSGGPFQSWKHWHRFKPHSEDGTCLTDQIEYHLRGWGLGQLLAGGMVRRRLEQMFAYRHQVTKTDIEDHFLHSEKATKTIAVTGASGLVGQTVCAFLRGGGHQVIELSRSTNPAEETQPCWNPETGEVSFGNGIPRVDSVIHLAGYGIADKRWNEKVKTKIRESRIGPTNRLSRFLADNNLVAESFICASATGYYGDRGEEVLTESASAGEGFLAETCEPWEQASEPLADAGIRTVQTRFGIILSARGGALQKMLFPFRMGAGGRVGSGNQYWSWISLYDTVRAIHFSVMHEKLEGPVNFTAPNPVKQKQFAKTLGKVLFRPSFVPMPGFLAKLALGEMANYLLLAGCMVIPEKLTLCGFKFVHNNLEEALRFELGRMLIDSKHNDQKQDD